MGAHGVRASSTKRMRRLSECQSSTPMPSVFWNGAARSSKTQTLPYSLLLAQLENYCSLHVLPFDEPAAAQYEEFRKTHRRVSSPDLKIAAIALVHDTTLITQNT